MRSVGIGDVVIAIAAILFVAGYVVVRSYERKIRSASGPWIMDQSNKRAEN
jgi:positive regulator of sigma E activity